MNSRLNIWALVPVKAFSAGKRRLSPVLNAIDRARLARAMFEDVLDLLAHRAFVASIKFPSTQRRAPPVGVLTTCIRVVWVDNNELFERAWRLLFREGRLARCVPTINEGILAAVDNVVALRLGQG